MLHSARVAGMWCLGHSITVMMSFASILLFCLEVGSLRFGSDDEAGTRSIAHFNVVGMFFSVLGPHVGSRTLDGGGGGAQSG